MSRTSRQEDRILDTALALADHRDWESVRLYDIAHALGISLDDIRRHYREKEDLVDAWFDRADEAMLAAAMAEDFQARPAQEKVSALLIRWLEALAPHRRVTRQMILGKLEPGHLHYQCSGLLRVSRTVQWLREAAGCRATLPLRALEETGLTAVYLATFLYWMFDDSQDSRATRTFLQKRLDHVIRLATGSGCAGEQGHVAPPGGQQSAGG